MATHKELLPRLVGAARGEKVTPLRIEGGSVNYRLMDDGTTWIMEPTEANERIFLGYLQEMKEVGHLTLVGPKGVACEQGAPAAHWTFNVGSVVAVCKFAIERKRVKLRAACEDFLIDEVGLNKPFRINKVIALCCPRAKDEKKEAPIDGYRNVFTSLALGERVTKSLHYWQEPLAVAVSTFREILPKLGLDFVTRARTAEMPRLYLPIRRVSLQDGGFLAYIEQTPAAEAAMGSDGCNWVKSLADGTITYGYDWSTPPTV